MKKILFVISTLDTGGAQRALSNIVTHLPDELEADILLNDTASIKYPYRGKLHTLGLKPQTNKNSIFYQLKVAVKRISTLRKLKKTNEYECCVSFLDSSNFANILSGNKHCKTVITNRTNPKGVAGFSKMYRYIVIPVAKLFYRKADLFVTVSKASEDYLRDVYKIKKERLFTIYNGYDIEEIKAKSKQSISPEIDKFLKDKTVIATTGRLNRSKGQWQAIRVLLEVKKVKPDAVLVIMGSGDLEPELKAYTQQLGLEDSVLFAGFMENPFAVLGRSHLFVFPTFFEGFPNALVEAMACGLPVAACDCDTGVREILAPKTDMSFHTDVLEQAEYGFLLPLGVKEYSNEDELNACEKALAESLKMLLSDEFLYEQYREKSLERAGQLSIEASVSEWLKLFFIRNR